MQNLKKMTIFGRSVLMAILIGLILSACTYPSERFHPQFPSYRQSMDAMLVLVPEIGMFEQMPDGSRIFQDIQSQEAQCNAQQAIVRELQERHFTVQAADPQMMQLTEIISVTSLFRSVNRSIQLHTFGPQLFPAKLSAFEYDLGSVADILKANRADGLVLALGHQTASGQPSKNWLSIAVVEPEGHIIWYSLQGDHQKFNLQTSEGMKALVEATLADLWEQGS
ncbi:hypothetical protein [uncultured Desulfosarcina sp.]|uniref:hypothetical protein n=1 Tax=uncultured Desulfosarcina sp. TaxID=218289 RepID=UPI0029C9A526|nr:hypothetical protein [uncultured Desulfosarcina sp.]